MVRQLQDGTAVRLTTARYYTPSGRSIQAEGIMPDVPIGEIKVAKSEDAETIAALSPHEADLSGRLANTGSRDGDQKDDTGGKNAKRGDAAKPDNKDDDAQIITDPAKVQENEDKLAQTDFQLFQALSLLKGLTIARAQ
jgi:carboxyl-terminal processing protease